jgi:hypothetical protein
MRSLSISCVLISYHLPIEYAVASSALDIASAFPLPTAAEVYPVPKFRTVRKIHGSAKNPASELLDIPSLSTVAIASNQQEVRDGFPPPRHPSATESSQSTVDPLEFSAASRASMKRATDMGFGRERQCVARGFLTAFERTSVEVVAGMTLSTGVTASVNILSACICNGGLEVLTEEKKLTFRW